MLKLYNTLSKQLEEFKPQKPSRVTMYTCGPTVYDHMHIGNLRTFVFSDILLRVLKYNGYKVEAAENITDIDDKIIKRAKEKNTTIDKVSKEYTKYFLSDITKLNIEVKNLKEQPRATEYVGKMVEYIKALLDKGFAYQEKDGSVYFDISKFVNYGKLSGVEKRELKTGTRVLSDEYTKENVQDFALWKAVGKDEVGFDSSFGRGRPGWHIECSVMSQTILGNKIDIHTGGIDLVFPHHENEIAQSEAKTGDSPFVKYWVHGAHMLVDGKKMSKSLNNFYTLSDLEKRGFEPLSLRYLFLQTHYRQEMNFTWEALEAAQNALNKLRKEVVSLGEPKIGCSELEGKFLSAVNDDLNMPQALSVLWETVNSDNPSSAKSESVLKFDEVLGLSLSDSNEILKSQEKELPEEVRKMLEEREVLRYQKKYEEADKIREKILKMGYKVEDKN
ncbi:cysteine--tRNA ligase [Patescibacteria group bacterium]|nr:cysteine--tRNA ligase [Patescibacteria group bacterium]